MVGRFMDASWVAPAAGPCVVGHHALPPTKWVMSTPVVRSRSEAEKIATSNYGLIEWTINHYRLEEHPVVYSGVYDRDDARADGWVGLVKAAERYNPELGALSTIAAQWIRAEIQRGRDRAAGSGFRLAQRSGSKWAPPLSLDMTVTSFDGADVAFEEFVAADDDDLAHDITVAEMFATAMSAATRSCVDEIDRSLLAEISAGMVLDRGPAAKRIASDFGVTTQTIYNRRNRLFAVMREALGNNADCLA